MRCEQKKDLKKVKIKFIKKIIAAAAAFLIVFCIAAVDRNCAEAAGQEEVIIPRIILVEEGAVKVKFPFGEICLEL